MKTLCAGLLLALGVVAFGEPRQAAAQCLGPGVNFGGKNNGWTMVRCRRSSGSVAISGGVDYSNAISATIGILEVLPGVLDSVGSIMDALPSPQLPDISLPDLALPSPTLPDVGFPDLSRPSSPSDQSASPAERRPPEQTAAQREAARRAAAAERRRREQAAAEAWRRQLVKQKLEAERQHQMLEALIRERVQRERNARLASAQPATHPAAKNPFASRPSQQVATGGDLTHGVTQQQCSTRGGRIIAFTSTAGQGPDVGDCYVPPHLTSSPGGGLAPTQPSVTTVTLNGVGLPNPFRVAASTAETGHSEQAPRTEIGARVASIPVSTPPAAGDHSGASRQPVANGDGQSGTVPKLIKGVTEQQCSALGGRIITFTNTAGQGPDVGECFVPPRVTGGAPQRKAARRAAPPRFQERVAPDIADEIRGLADSVLALAVDDPNRPPLIRKLMRLAADYGMGLPPDLLACLQPTNGSGGLVEIPLRWRSYHIQKEAIDQSHLCDGAPDADAKEVCRQEKYGEAVMWAEPDIASLCRAQEASNNDDVAAVAECAKRRFLNAWAHGGVLQVQRPSDWVTPPACDVKAPPEDRSTSLREKLRAALARPHHRIYDEPSAEPPAAAESAPAATAEASPPAPPSPDENEAYCNYMAREVVRGELTPGPATAIPAECRATIAAAQAYEAQHPREQFRMDPVETDRAIAKLLRQPSASGGPK